MDGALIQAIAVGCGIGLPALGAGVAVVFKIGRVEGRTSTKLEVLSGSVESQNVKIDDLTKGVGDCVSRISTVEGYLTGKKNKGTNG